MLRKPSIIINYIAGAILIITLIWVYNFTKKDKEILTKDGKKIVGVVTEVVKRKRGIDIKYQFTVDKKIYTSWDKTYKEIFEGDSILVIYDPKNPKLSKPSLELKDEN